MEIKNKELYKKVKQRGFCLCQMVKTKESMCPCPLMKRQGLCKCGVFENDSNRN